MGLHSADSKRVQTIIDTQLLDIGWNRRFQRSVVLTVLRIASQESIKIIACPVNALLKKYILLHRLNIVIVT